MAGLRCPGSDARWRRNSRGNIRRNIRRNIRGNISRTGGRCLPVVIQNPVLKLIPRLNVIAAVPQDGSCDDGLDGLLV